MKRSRAMPNAARGWRPALRSESNWWAPALKPSLSRVPASTLPLSTSSGPACSRSPRGLLGSIPRGAISTSPPSIAMHDLQASHGESNGTDMWTSPPVRSSPSGVVDESMWKPPASASATGLPRTHERSGCGGSSATTRTRVVRRGQVATYTLVDSPPESVWTYWRGRFGRRRSASETACAPIRARR
jgi:hypothetical protein